MKTTVSPVSERISSLDVLRGFALIGVLMVNLLDFSSSALRLDTLGIRGSVIDQIADLSVVFFALTKFYLVFSFLFGMGFSVQMRRMEAANRPFVGFYLRRLLILFLIGVAHAVLVWEGDILTLYALAGVLLLLVRKVSARILGTIAGGITVAGLLWFSGVPFGSFSNLSLTEAIPLIKSGSYLDLVSYRLNTPIVMDIQIPMVLVMFLVGLIVGRSGVMEHPERYRPVLRRTWKWVLPVALVSNGLFIVGYEMESMWMISTGVHVGAPLLSFVYVSLVLLYTEKMSFFSPVGRMALTNYLLQSVVATTLFYGYGLGLYDSISPTGVVVGGLLFFAGQILFSTAWLSRFRFGPMEWLWRSLTYGKRQPFLR